MAASYEAAAVGYLEDVSSVIGAEDDETEAGATVQVIVRDLEHGGEHCFRIDLDTGAAWPCA